MVPCFEVAAQLLEDPPFTAILAPSFAHLGTTIAQLGIAGPLLTDDSLLVHREGTWSHRASDSC